MKNASFIILIIIFVALFSVVKKSFFTVKETHQVIVTQFGDPVGKPIVNSGLKFKIPFIQEANFFEKRILEWDGTANEMPTKDKTYIIVDTYARWQIIDALKYFRKLRDERSAMSRLDDILGSETRNVIAKHELIEVIRSTKGRKPLVSDDIAKASVTQSIGNLIPIKYGRDKLEKDIFATSKKKLGEFGIDLLDVRFKRINYNQSVRDRIYDRMISERNQIAERFRSEGNGEAEKILGNMEKELSQIKSESYKRVEEIKGKADAQAAKIYSDAYNVSDSAMKFYEFLKTMEIYSSMLEGDTNVILSTDSELFKFFKNSKFDFK